MICRATIIPSVLALFAAALTLSCSDEEKGTGGGDSDTVNNADSGDGGPLGDGGDGTSGDSIILPDTIITTDTVEETRAEVEVTPGGFGSPCNENGNCESGYCVDGPKGYVCTRTCDTTCPVGYECKAVSGGTDTVFLCLPQLQDNCTPCADNFQCQGGLCMTIDGEKHCAYECGKEGECPVGFKCDETDQAAGLFCQPETGSCTCFAENDGGLRSCTTPSDLGVCVGVSECDTETGWSACSAVEAVPEVCNGMDDDCNGVWDDKLEGAGGPCVNAVAGVGECKGTKVCLGVAGWLCVGPTPLAEVCNGLDDNCDGVADDPFKVNGIYSGDNNCGGCGIVCEGKVVNATAFCSTAGGGTPRCEVLECAPGYYKAGPLTCLPIEDFSCVPCLTDAHCTTPGDRCLQIDGGNFCGRDCAAGNAHQSPAGSCPAGYSCEDLAASEGPGVRQCVPNSGSCTCLGGDAGEQRPCSRVSAGATCFGAQTCNPGTGWSACDAKTPVAEVCNAFDDNCNAVIDDVAGRFETCNVTNSFGTCPGAFDCRPGSTSLTCVGQVPATEICNGRDDDCNGQTDNVVPPLCPKQTGVCAGSRQICAGSAGFLGCNIGSYGGAFEVNETKCDGIDNDCDGRVDEVDIDGDGHRPIACGGDDCDDTDRLSYPGASELCGDFADNDCNGVADDRDFDQDGWIAVQCGGEDCNDNSPLASPTGAEVCGDRVDNDCDGSVDNKDADGDGFIDKLCGGGDCNDARNDIKPGAPEQCDGLDNDCNGIKDEKDLDADGYVDIACGGDDCDDTRPIINPGGIEVCGNTYDEDCSGILNDRDVDNDGAKSTLCGGTDCDDFDPQTYVGAPEVWDTKDNDCDGIYDEGVVPPGSVIISEIMIAPTITAAEWFEVTNIAAYPISMRGWRITSLGVAAQNAGFTIALNQILQPGEAIVLCNIGAFDQNGGVECDYEYSGGINLSNTSPDSITITVDATVMDETLFTGSTPGRARSLKTEAYNATSNNAAGNWCALPASGYDFNGAVDGTDQGTPGVLNPADCSATPPPGVSLVTPFTGLATGGELVTIFGSGFVSGKTSVSIGGSACGSVGFVSANIVTCITTAHAVGPVSVIVSVGDTPVASQPLLAGYTYTDAGNGPFTSATLVNANPYTVAAGLPGPLITVSVAPGAVPGARAELGYGPTGSDPTTTVGWRWIPAIRTASAGTDIFVRALAITTAGTFPYAFRVSADGATWLYTPTRTATITP